MSHPFACLDTEDNSPELMAAGLDPFKKRVTQIAAVTASGAHYYSKGNVADCKRWIRQRPETVFYAHNLQYDLGNLFADTIDELDVTLVGGRLIRAVWGPKTFYDSFNIWPMAAKKLGQAFGLEKLEMDIHSREYVFRDVEIIRRAMLFAWNFCAPLGVKLLPATLGGLCVKLWQAWGGENVHDSSPISREALFGGRVELFKPESESGCIAYTDINSLYPSVMRQKFPSWLEPMKVQGPKSKVQSLPEYGVARVTVRVPECEIAPLPFREPETGRILYPWGRFTGVWCIPEIKNAVEHGAKIERVHECLGTDEFIEPYGVFVNNLYGARQVSTSDAESLFFKLCMNNLYGRLGVQGEVGRSVHQTERNKGQGIPYGSKVMVKYPMPLPEVTNWCHAAYVTAYGRLALQSHLRKVGSERLIYCDTDSTIFDTPHPVCNYQQSYNPLTRGGMKHGLASGNIPFPISSELGEMKLESWEKHAECYAPKSYRYGNDYKAKGVPKRLAKEFIQTRHVEYDLPYKFREAITFFDRDNRKKLSVWRRVGKDWQTEYDRKRLGKDGRFHPCKINRP